MQETAVRWRRRDPQSDEAMGIWIARGGLGSRQAVTMSVESKGFDAASMKFLSRPVFLMRVGEVLFRVRSALSANLPAAGGIRADKSNQS